MDEQIGAFACALSGAGLFAAVGAVFGGLARYLARLHGQAAGGVLGRLVTDSLQRVSGREMAPLTAAAISGSVEGAVFLGVFGSVVGLVAARAAEPFQTLASVTAGFSLLAFAAALFGLVAYGMLWLGVRVVGGVFLGGISGALAGARLAGAHGILLGTVAGALFGMVVGLLTAPRLPAWPPDESPQDNDNFEV
jgi:hypothetical protein